MVHFLAAYATRKLEACSGVPGNVSGHLFKGVSIQTGLCLKVKGVLIGQIEVGLEKSFNPRSFSAPRCCQRKRRHLRQVQRLWHRLPVADRPCREYVMKLFAAGISPFQPEFNGIRSFREISFSAV
jgi:hypothetical protein